jgi:hypothetical protein
MVPAKAARQGVEVAVRIDFLLAEVHYLRVGWRRGRCRGVGLRYGSMKDDTYDDTDHDI